MRALALGIGLALAALVTGTPETALCQRGCLTPGATCYNDLGCFEPCRCILPEGLGKPGFCS